MNTLPTDCLSPEALEHFAASTSGQQDPEQAHEHLAVCVTCRAALAEIRSNNDLLTAVLPTKRAGLKSSLAAPDHLTIPGYTLGMEVHRGAQGVVYQATQLSTRRNVAIKVMRGSILADQAARMRFEREVQILAQLRHPHIVTIHDSGSAGGVSYLVMDYVEGLALDEFLCAHAALSSRRVADTRKLLVLFAQIAEAVNAAHLKGVIHRDLKPSNIRIDANGEPKILDFGLARLTEDAESCTDAQSPAHHLTLTGQFVGSLPYASPEQAEGRPERVDTRSDVYALGVTLYRLVMGVFPYAVTGSLPDVLDNIRHTEPAPMRKQPGRMLSRKQPKPYTDQLPVPMRIDDEVETIVLKCLDKEPERRYQTAGELGRDLRHYLAGEPIEARRDSGWYVARKLLWKHRVVAIAGGLVAASLLLGAVGTTAGWLWALRQRDRALLAEDQTRTQEQLASAEAAKFKAVNDLLQNDMLGSIDPNQAQGRDVTILEVLDSFTAQIDEGSLEGNPEVEAELRATLGRMYARIAKFEPAAEQMRRGLELREHLTGGRADPSWLEELDQYSDLLKALGRNEESLAIARRTTEMARALHSGDHPAVVRSLNRLALAPGISYQEQEQALREALAMQRRLDPHDNAMLVGTINNLGHLCRTLGRYDEAETLLRDGLEMARRVYRGDHTEVIAHMNNLGLLLHDRGDLAGAEAIAGECLEMMRRVYPQDHPDLGAAINNLALVLRKQGKQLEAEPLAREALEMWQRLVPGDHVDTALGLKNLAELLHALDCMDEAELLARAALDMRRRIDGASPSASLAACACGLASILHTRSARDESEALARECVAVRAATLPPDHPARASALGLLGQILIAQGAYSEAEPLLRECLTIRVQRLKPADPLIGQAHSHLGACLTGLEQFADAEIELRAAQAILSEIGDAAQAMEELDQRLAALYAVWGISENLVVGESTYETVAQPASEAETNGIAAAADE